MMTRESLLAVVMIVYVIVMFAISLWAQRRIESSEDYLVAGRRLPLLLAWATILATWFGAATVLTAADEVHESGIQKAALDPFGAGLCLIVAGLFFAVPLWKMGLLTLSDFFRRRFGPRAELLSALIMVPSYFGWIASQFVALSKLLQEFYGGESHVWILVIAAIGRSSTLLGGMWSVSLTDAIQIVLVMLGLVVLAIAVLIRLDGLGTVLEKTEPDRLRMVPENFHLWLGALCIGIFGNIPGQDLTQRIFAAKSESVARKACLIAGGLYLLFGLIPVLLGLAASQVEGVDLKGGVVLALGKALLDPIPFTIFMLALLSAVLSTIDSAILSPASVLSQNVLPRSNFIGLSSLSLNRLAVVLVTLASVGLTFMKESAYELLEAAYALTLVGLVVPLALGIYLKRGGEVAACSSMLVGTGIWMWHFVMNADQFLNDSSLPHRAVVATLAALLAYLLVGWWSPARHDETVQS